MTTESAGRIKITLQQPEFSIFHLHAGKFYASQITICERHIGELLHEAAVDVLADVTAATMNGEEVVSARVGEVDDWYALESLVRGPVNVSMAPSAARFFHDRFAAIAARITAPMSPERAILRRCATLICDVIQFELQRAIGREVAKANAAADENKAF